MGEVQKSSQMVQYSKNLKEHIEPVSTHTYNATFDNIIFIRYYCILHSVQNKNNCKTQPAQQFFMNLILWEVNALVE